MTHTLTVLIADIEGPEQRVDDLFRAWASLDLLDRVALVDISLEDVNLSSEVTYAVDGAFRTLPLSAVLGSERWTSIVVAALRAGPLGGYDSSRWGREDKLASSIRSRFLQAAVRSVTVGIAQEGGSADPRMFTPTWDLHLLHDPVQISDLAVATMPVIADDRPGLVLLTAVVVSGALRWQSGPAIDIRDPANDNRKRVRICRVQLRVIDAGHLTAEVMRGAFPVSGPWTVPAGVSAVAAGVGAKVPSILVDQIADASRLRVQPFAHPPAMTRTSIGLFAGLRLWLRSLGKALRDAPFIIVRSKVAAIENRLEQGLQDLTFGSSSSVVVKVRPQQVGLDADWIVDKLYEVDLPDIAPPAIPDPEPWRVLRRTAFALCDGASLPNGVSEPTMDGVRMLYVDPWSIGPGPSDEDFRFSELEASALGLGDGHRLVEPMDVVRCLAVEKAINSRSTEGVPPEGLTDDSEISIADRGAPLPAVDVEIALPGQVGFNPADFDPITVFYQGRDAAVQAKYAEQNLLLAEKSAEHDTIGGRWAGSRRCDFCGTGFHVGVAYLHKPSSKLVHVGRVCAAKAHLKRPAKDVTQDVLRDLRHRWTPWLQRRRDSLLFQVSSQLEGAIEIASTEMAAALREFGAETTDVAEAGEKKRQGLRRWTRMLAITLLAIATVVMLVMFGVFSLPFLAIAWWIAIAGSLVLGLMLRCVSLAKAMARSQYQVNEAQIRKTIAARRSRHYAVELVRLTRARQQFADWQKVIRSVVHAPFGAPATDTTGDVTSADFDRPYAFIYARSAPAPEQLQLAQLRARRQTVHPGWMSSVYEQLVHAWRRRYEPLVMAEPPEPEGDNSPAGTIQVRLPADGSLIFTARQDFAGCVASGAFRDSVVESHSQEIMDWLGNLDLSELLMPVQVQGSGVALNGLGSMEFLDGLTSEQDFPDFSSELFGLTAAATKLRRDNVEARFPPADATATREPRFLIDDGAGRSLLFSSSHIAISPAVDLSLLSVTFQDSSASSIPIEEDHDEPRA